MPFVQTADKTELHYTDWGQGRPVVLIHGWPLSSSMWEYQAAPLVEAGFRVVAYDRRGFGKSSQPYSGYDYDTLADDLACVLDHLDLEDAVLVGFSMGGGDVARYMSRHEGQRVGKVALVSAVTPFLLKGPDNPDGVDGSIFEGMIEGLKADRPHFLYTFSKGFFNAGMLNFQISDETRQQFMIEGLKASAKATIDCVEAFGRTDFRGDLRHFTVPTLVIHGDADQTVPFEASGKRIPAMLPGAELKVYEGSPHALNVTDKQKLTEDLAAFARI
ncbi:arylesterase [Aureimonas sp. Leaf454]|uniref:alpha/beta fold hydrolase n=1 Tax=Aureimonas sp. Leaf454 TaxID=1736381 RepID=UPI0007014872|nr:alpha/beta hydrolase [Aureimonas sp. Leaf454]KQT43061.1 arylesterase [Aureimonas sp. Leaf454]